MSTENVTTTGINQEASDAVYMPPITFPTTENGLQQIEQAYPPDAIPSDLSVKENYEAVKKGVAHVRKLRNEVEAHRKELKKTPWSTGAEWTPPPRRLRIAFWRWRPQ